MPNQDYQRHSFLGGEVSPSLYERADMDKFGKWFSKAENIRFRETGAFRNRCGFVKIADTKYNTSGDIIKLLSFSFNDEESFLVELGGGYARFYRKGHPIMNGNEPYELATPFLGFSDVDIKYAQAGDTIFLVHPDYGIYELIRLQADGSSWEFKKFGTDILPMKEENEDKSKAVTLSSYEEVTKTLSLLNPDSSVYDNVSVTFDGQAIFTSESTNIQGIFEGITNAIGASYDIVLDGTTIYIKSKTSGSPVPDSSITFSSTGEQDYNVSNYSISSWSATASISFSNFSRLTSVYVKGHCSDPVQFEGTKNISADTIQESLALAAGYGSFYVGKGVIYPYTDRYYRSDGITYDQNAGTMSYNVNGNIDVSYRAYITLYGKRVVTNTYTYNSASISSATEYYTLTANNASILSDLQNGECLVVKHTIDEQVLTGRVDPGEYTEGPIKSDGNWRFYTLGNWQGKIQIQYSTDNKQTWVNYYEWVSQDANDSPANVNTSGTLVTDDLVWFRLLVDMDVKGNTPLQYTFVAKSFTINSYYKIIFKNSSTSAVVECIKNDVGAFSNNTNWRKPAFSMSEGWPQTVAFYQNRLFFGKDYIIYGSRNNDFWDFYEPVKLQADDPITMSLLSTKVNSIRNLLTQRSFFTFTAGGEFGIGSEGALTQSDKYLKPFSSNGSAQCTPVLISDVVLFVDKSYNTVRALKYSLESDGYEAPDITITLKALLDNEKIISTDIIYEEKEALFLSNTGTIWVLKYITDQNVLSWSHWQHAFGKITNIAVVPNGPKHDLYIAVESNGKKWIEKMVQTEFMDTVESFPGVGDTEVAVTGKVGDKKIVLQGNLRGIREVYYDSNLNKNMIRISSLQGDDHGGIDRWQPFKVGSVYTSTATLLSPVVQASDYSHNSYETKNPFKVFFYYLNSYGFKVGVEEDEKMEIEWQPVNSDIDDEIDLTSGKKSVLIPSRFEHSARVSFVQEEPYPMEVADMLIQTDYGGK